MKKIPTLLGIIAGLLLVMRLFSAEPESATNAAKPETKPAAAETKAVQTETKAPLVETPPLPPTTPPGKDDLQSVKAAQEAKVKAAEPPRFPVYVIPETVAVQTPNGVIVFAERYHVEELARKFPSQRITNVIIWNRP